MTTLELFKKHRKGEVSRERFLYEVRRDSNLPWITNVTSYDDAVKILKNKGIIREAQFEPQNIATDPVVDRVNPYALKREVEKILSKETELTNDSYKQALNKAAKKLTTPDALKKSMFSNAETVAKADAKLQTKEVKKNNLVDKDNGMKKAKGQETPKATSAPTKENKKTKKPKGVEVMKDKGVEGSEKVIKEISEYLKKKLRLQEHNTFNNFYEGMVVPTQEGEAVVKKIDAGTLHVEMSDGTLKAMQMSEASRLIEKSKELPQSKKEIGAKQEYESGYQQMEEGSNTLTTNLNDIQSQISTSSVIETADKMSALNAWEETMRAFDEKNWETALNSLEELKDLIQQIIPEEYEQYYSELFNDAINQLEFLVNQSDDADNFDYDEELEEKVGQVVDSTGETIKLTTNPTTAQQYVNSQEPAVRSQLTVKK